MKKKIPKDDINSLIAILPKYIDVGCWLQKNRAGQYKYDIETAAAHLHGMIDAARNDV